MSVGAPFLLGFGHWQSLCNSDHKKKHSSKQIIFYKFVQERPPPEGFVAWIIRDFVLTGAIPPGCETGECLSIFRNAPFNINFFSLSPPIAIYSSLNEKKRRFPRTGKLVPVGCQAGVTTWEYIGPSVAQTTIHCHPRATPLGPSPLEYRHGEIRLIENYPRINNTKSPHIFINTSHFF